MISRALMVLVIISSFPVVSTLQVPPRAIAQTTSEAVRVLVDDVIQDLKSNNTSKAEVHLSILNQQLTTRANSSSIQFAKVLINDAINALNSNNSNSALIHLNLIKQQLIPSEINVSSSTSQSAKKSSQTQTSVKTNTSTEPIKLKHLI